MFPKAQSVREVVKYETDQDRLGTHAATWNKSTFPGYKHARQDIDKNVGADLMDLNFSQRRFMIRKGLLD